MAEEKTGPPPENNNWIWITMIVLFILWRIFAAFPVDSTYFSKFNNVLFKAVLSGEFADNPMKFAFTSILVKTVRDVSVYDNPYENIIGSQDKEIGGQLVGGPVGQDGRVWKVNFKTGEDGWVSENALWPTGSSFVLLYYFSKFASSYSMISLVITFLLITGIIYAAARSGGINNEMYKHYMQTPVDVAVQSSSKNYSHPKWKIVEEHIESENPNDWRLAIMEADIILEEMLDGMHYLGTTMGEKLKAVERSDFNSIDAAWEAHKIRNQIAHEGSDFGLTKREARRVIELYRVVFEEFRLIEPRQV